VVLAFKTWQLSGAERNDAAHWIVRGDAYRHAIAGHDLDAETPHASAQLREHFMTRVTLHTIKTA
jgi:hypothetical protein